MSHLDIQIREKRFQSRNILVLNNLRFEVASGDFISIVGPSGAGKTTILNIVGGLDREITGRILIDGKPLTEGDKRVRYGYMFQEPRLLPWLTVNQNIELVIADKPDKQQRAQRLLKVMDLADTGSAYPLELSGGMQRRVALARAFAVEPTILLMDEPFLSLDQPTANRLRSQLLSLWQALQPTVIFVTHDLREALALSDRVVFLSGSPASVVKEWSVDLARPRDIQGNAVSTLHDRLLSDYPDLLAGLVSEQDNRSVLD